MTLLIAISSRLRFCALGSEATKTDCHERSAWYRLRQPDTATAGTAWAVTAAAGVTSVVCPRTAVSKSSVSLRVQRQRCCSAVCR